MSNTDLDAKLARLSHFTNPPADVVADAMSAYAARVAELEAVIAAKDARISEEVSFQRFIRESEQETRHELTKRHDQPSNVGGGENLVKPKSKHTRSTQLE